MTPAIWPRAERDDARLLLIGAAEPRLLDRRLGDLPALLRGGDVLVVNDAATLPASLEARSASGPLEVRLLAQRDDLGGFAAVLFGPGSWRQRTEDRSAPPVVEPGTPLRLASGLTALVESVSTVSPRLVDLRFDRSGAELWPALYAAGRPVQYSYLCGPLSLWHVQTAYATRPWAMELPSAGRPLSLGLLRQLRARGTQVCALTHATGLSASGDQALDASLPLPERYEIPPDTAVAVASARAQGRRVIAVGTSVVRALEGCARRHAGRVTAGVGVTSLRLGPRSRLRVVSGLLTGLHEPGTSHHGLLQAFAPAARLETALDHAAQAGYLGHEFGDLALVLTD